MKYIKVSCDMESSHESLGWDTSKFLELGWELGVTHLQVKRMKNNNEIDNDDIIVVSKDRSFLYENVFNTINYKDFIKIEKPQNFIDLTLNTHDYLKQTSDMGYYKNKKYTYWDNDIDLIKNINYDSLKDFKTDESFFIIHARFRKWAEERNFSFEFWEDKIKKLVEYYNIKCFVFGEGTEKLCDGVNVINVNLKEYASLLHHENCKFMVGSMSGGSMISQLCCRDGCPVFIIENHRQIPEHPLFHDESINFSKSVVMFVKNKDEISNVIINNLK